MKKNRGGDNVLPGYPAKRNDIGPWLTELGLTGTGVEVGVFRGDFSDVLLETSELRLLYMVDLWEHLPEDCFDKPNMPCNVTGAELIRQIEEKFGRKFGNRYKLIQKPSVDASTVFVDGVLDFVYIDADHSYQAVMDDIAAWMPKVKPGGVIAGHD